MRTKQQKKDVCMGMLAKATNKVQMLWNAIHQ